MKRSIYHKYVLTLSMVLFSVNSIYSQSRMFQGMVIDDLDLEPVIFAEIFVNDSIKIGRTGMDGCFQFETSLPIKKLTFTSAGMEDAILRLSEKCNHIELIMISWPHRCFMSLRKIDKERRKIYKNLPKLHNEAYEKGIFQSPEACYTQEYLEYSELE